MFSSDEGTYVPVGSTSVNVSWTIPGLDPGASYRCRLEGDNAGGVSYSPEQTFTTPMATSYVTPGAPAPLRLASNELEVFARLSGVGDQLSFTRYTGGNWGIANLNASQPKMAASAAVIQMKAQLGIHAFAPNTNGDLICFYKNPGGAWASVNLTQATGGLKLAKETPAVVESAPNQLSVFARATNNDLVSYERAANGVWTMFNESAATGWHPTIDGSPAPVVLDPGAYAGSNLIVLARNASNELIAFSRLASGGWLPYNITANTGVSIHGNPSAVRLDPNVYAGSGLGVYARNLNNELISFDRQTYGTWLTYNVSANSNGNVKIQDTPAPIRLEPGKYADSVLGIYARSANDDLVSFDRHTNGGWTLYNVSAANNYPKITSPPSVMRLDPNVYAGSGLQVYARTSANELIAFDRLMSGGWLNYNVTNNVSGKPKVEAPAPEVSAVEVSEITEQSAKLSATVNPKGVEGRYKFECGAGSSGSYTFATTETSLAAGSSPVNVSATINELYPGVTNHCRLWSYSEGGVALSDAKAFTTPMVTSYATPGAPAPLRLTTNALEVFSRLSGVGDQLAFTRATSGAWSLANLTPAGQPKMGASAAVVQIKAGVIHAFAPNANGDLIDHYKNPGGPWAWSNLTTVVGATLKLDKATPPAVVESAPNQLSVFARATNGDLVSYERTSGGSWSMLNESVATSGHPTIASSPAAVVLDPNRYAGTNLIVLARSPIGQLISFNRLTSGSWTPYNITANSPGNIPIIGNPSALRLDPNIYAGSGLGVYARTSSNELVSFDRQMGGNWTVYNITNNLGGLKIIDTPAPIRLDPSLYAGSVLGIYARSANDDLVSFDRQAGGAWSLYNVSAANGYPKITSPPSVMRLDPSIYAGSGLGVYARNSANELIAFDRLTNGGWLNYNVTNNVAGKPKVE
jgi:hypothetical protein